MRLMRFFIFESSNVALVWLHCSKYLKLLMTYGSNGPSGPSSPPTTNRAVGAGRPERRPKRPWSHWWSGNCPICRRGRRAVAPVDMSIAHAMFPIADAHKGTSAPARAVGLWPCGHVYCKCNDCSLWTPTICCCPPACLLKKLLSAPCTATSFLLPNIIAAA